MIFENQPIDVHELPQLEVIPFDQPAPAYWKVSIYSTLIFLAFLVAGLSVYLFLIEKELPSLSIIGIGYGIWSIFALFLLWLTHKGFAVKGYCLRQQDITYKKGVFFHSMTTIPFNRVQHCEIKQGPIERYFGLKTLEIYTAGGQSSDLSIPGLRNEEAQNLKEFIIKNTAQDGSEEE